MTYVLKPHQKRIVDENKPRALLALGTGTGKSLTAIRLMEKNKVSCIQVICPKSIKEEWYRKHEEYGCKIPLLVATKEEMKASKHLVYKPNTGVIIDESHKVVNPTSGLFKALIKYLKQLNPEYIYCLSATPLTKNAWSLFGHAKILGFNPNYVKFRSVFFAQVRMGPRIVWLQRKKIGYSASSFLSKINTYTIDLKDVTKVGQAIHEIQYIGLTPSQITIKEDIEMKETMPIVLNTKIHQLEQGQIKGDEFTDNVFVDSLKTERIIELAEEFPKLAVVVRYNLQIDHLKDILQKEGHKVYVIRGGVKDVAQVANMSDRASKCVLLIQAEVSEGYELPHFDTVVIASLSWSYIHYKQIIGRFVRLQHAERPKLYIHLQVSSGIDEKVYKSMMQGEDYQAKIYEKNKV